MMSDRFTWIATVLAVGILLNIIALGVADTFRIGRRVPGDTIVLKKVLLSVPSNIPTNHTVIYEYLATRAVSCIEYQVENIADEERCTADIAFTGEYSLAATFHLVNITELVIVMSIYGFDRFAVPLDFRPILVPQHLQAADGGTPKFGLGFRRDADELVYFYTQSTTRTDGSRNHSLVFETTLEHYITYVSFAVDSKTAGVTFLLMTEHEFRGIVYDTNTHILFANLYIYGYKAEKLPADYVPMLPTASPPDSRTLLDAVPFNSDDVIELRGAFKGSAVDQNGGSEQNAAADHYELSVRIIASVVLAVFCILY